MTAAVEFRSSAPSLTPPVQLTTCAEECARQDSDFAVLLTALARPSATATEHGRLDLLPVTHSDLAMAAPRRQALHERRAAEFRETSIFGLMGVIALADDAKDGVAVAQQAEPSSETGVPRPLQQTHAPDIAVCRAILGSPSTSETAQEAGTQSVSPRLPSGASSRAHTSSRPQDAVSDAAPATVRVQRSAENHAPERLSFHRAEQRAFFLASGQASAVHVAITVAEHGLSVFARVGRMEPTERARLRHAATLLLAEHGYRGATVTLDADAADAKGGMSG